MVKGKETAGAGAVTRNQSSDLITHTVLQEELEKFRVILSDSLADSTRQTVDRSFVSLQSSINSKVNDLQDEIKSISFDFKQHVQQSEETFKKLNDRIDQLETAALHTAIHQNNKEQRFRAKSFRLHGYKLKAKNVGDTLSEVYNYIISPSFSKAVENEELDETPSLAACGAYAHALKPRKQGDCPAILFKFITRQQKEIFMKYARSVCTSFNDARDPNSREDTIRVGPDLTPTNRRIMTSLYKVTDVDKVRLGSQGVQFSLKSNPTKWKNVENPYGKCLADYQVKIANPLLDTEDD